MYHLHKLLTYTSNEKSISIWRSDIDIFVAFHTVDKIYNVEEEMILHNTGFGWK